MESPAGLATGEINGAAHFQGSANHSGIAVTLEQTDGLRSLSVQTLARSPAIDARSVATVHSVSATMTDNEQ